MRVLSLWLAVLSGAVGAPARADTFLGEDQDSPAEQAPKPKKKKKAKKPKIEASVASEGSGEDPEAPPALDDEPRRPVPLVFSGALGSGTGYINAQVTVGYYFNRFIGIDTSFYYYRQQDHDDSGQQYGPEVDLVLRGANPTIVTPFIGVGPGYTKWQRTAAGQSFDASSSWTANEFAGVDVRLTSHFGISVMRKQQTYLGTPPKTFSNHQTAEAKSSWSTNIGFRLAF